jgi:hypothetical protein
MRDCRFCTAHSNDRRGRGPPTPQGNRGADSQKIQAQGLQGIAVKLALWSKYAETHGIEEPESDAIASICKTVENLTGFDVAAKDADW